jgi:hypothetical protein
MTVAPHAPARTRLLVALLAAVFCLVLGVAVLRELGAWRRSCPSRWPRWGSSTRR